MINISILLGIYFIILLILGYISSRKQSAEGFFIANRNLSVFQAMCSISASFIGAGSLLVITGLVYQYGIAALWSFVGYFLGFIIFSYFAVYIKKRSDEKKYLTLSDYFYDRFGITVSNAVTLCVLIGFSGMLSSQFIGGAKILTQISSIPYTYSLFLIGIVILVYILLGGFKSVIKTDVFQFLLILVMPIILILSLNAKISVPAEYYNVFNAPVVLIISFFVYGIFTCFAHADFWQRAYAIKDVKLVKRTFLFSGLAVILFAVLFTYFGLIARTYFPNTDADLAIINSFTKLIPGSMLVFVLVLFFAVIMSSADTLLFLISMNWSHDFLDKFFNFSDKKKLFVTRIFIFVISIFALSVALFFQKMVDVAIMFMSVLLIISPLVIISWLSKKVNRLSLKITIYLVLLIILILAFSGIIVPELILVSIVGSFLVYYASKFIIKRIKPTS